MDLGVQILRILCAVVEEQSFSGAARKLKITQPTVSQQIARLESEIDGRIFERSGKSIHLTLIGQKLYKTAKEIVTKADLLSSEINEYKMSPQGLVRYAMPESCQWTPHYHKIMSLIADSPQTQLEIEINTNQKIQELLNKSEVDFAFVTGEIDKPECIVQKFADEHYSLVAKSKDFFEPLISKRFENFRFVGFPGCDAFMITWADANGLLSQLRHSLTHPNVKVGNMVGAIHAALAGAGVAIVPTHCILDEMEKGLLVEYRTENSKLAAQPIYLIKRANEVLPLRSQAVMDLLIKAKNGQV